MGPHRTLQFGDLNLDQLLFITVKPSRRGLSRIRNQQRQSIVQHRLRRARAKNQSFQQRI